MEFFGIVGSRGYAPLMAVEKFIESLPAGSCVVTGTYPDLKPGGFRRDRVDERAARVGYARQLAVIVHPPLWRGWDGEGSYSAWAGKARNTLIVRDSGHLVAFWDGESDGTRDAIDKAEKKGIPVTIVPPWSGTARAVVTYKAEGS